MALIGAAEKDIDTWSTASTVPITDGKKTPIYNVDSSSDGTDEPERKTQEEKEVRNILLQMRLQ